MKSSTIATSLLIFCCLIPLVHLQGIPVGLLEKVPDGPGPAGPDPRGVPLLPLCEPGAEIPDDLIQCGSCQRRCGRKSNPSSLFSTSPGAQCSCDVFCGYHGDCCQDFQDTCPEVFQDFRQRSEQYPFTRSFDDFQCKSISIGVFQKTFNSMITTCPDGSECAFKEELSEDVNSFVPMYDVIRGVHFINGHCAVCNGAEDVIPWGVTLECNPVPDPKDYIKTGVVNSTDSLTDIKRTGACDLIYTRRGETRPCFSGVMVSRCPDTCLNQKLVSLCEGDFQAWTVSGGVYRNVYCAVCNNFEFGRISSLTCGQLGTLPGIEGNKKPRPFGSFSLTLVFDFDPRKGLAVGRHLPPECPDGEVYVPDEDVCRQVTCSSGFVLYGSDCVPEPSNITAVVTGRFMTEPSAQMLETLNKDSNNLETDIKNKVMDIFDKFNVTYPNLILSSVFQNSNHSLETEVNISCNCDFSSLLQNEDQAEGFEASVRAEVRTQVVEYLFSRNLLLTSIDVDFEFQLTNISTLKTQNSECTWLLYPLNETQTENDTLKVIPTWNTYQPGEFQILGDDVIVCESDVGIQGNSIDDVTFALDIITIVCVGISIICLIIRILLQCFIPAFRNRPGKLQLHLTVAFLIAFVMLLVGPPVSGTPDVCTSAAILMAYGFLAAFTWMNVIAVDTWLVFRPSAAFSRSSDEEKSLFKHYSLGWGIPLVLVAISIGMNYSDVSIDFRPEFGGARCWYTQRYAMLVYFGVPIAISILLNIIVYILTSFSLHRAFQNATNVIKAEGYHFGIYVRLFILMGITWIFGFVSAFTDQIVVDFIFVILTSLQGLFLFISVVCNKRILAEISKKTKSGTSSSSYEKRTKSTPLPSFDSGIQSDSKV